MLKQALQIFFFIMNLLLVDIWLVSGVAYMTTHLIIIYFVIGFLSSFLQSQLKRSLILHLINIATAFFLGILIFGYTKFFPYETNFIPSNPLENFLIMCPVSLVVGSFGIIINYGIRKSFRFLKQSGF